MVLGRERYQEGNRELRVYISGREGLRREGYKLGRGRYNEGIFWEGKGVSGRELRVPYIRTDISGREGLVQCIKKVEVNGKG